MLAGGLAVRQLQPNAVGSLRGDGEFRIGGEAVDRHRIGSAGDTHLTLARPADDRKEQRRGPSPPGRVGGPQQLHAARRPGDRLSATRSDRSEGRVAGEMDEARFRHRRAALPRTQPPRYLRIR